MSILNWLRLSNVMDHAGEWHAFIEGASDGFCRQRTDYKPYDSGNEDENLLESIRKEHHYYSAGKGCGFWLLIATVAAMIMGIIALVCYFLRLGIIALVVRYFT